MKKILTKIKQNTLGFAIGAILFGGIGVYAAITYNAKEVEYKNKTVEQALDELYKGKSEKICKRATLLHTEICAYTYCQTAGIGLNSLITYGNLGTKGTLASGDAFDCDVNGDGIYNAATERFYYVSNYYNTTTKKFESDTAVLIYYNNVSGGVADNTTTYAYNSDNVNYNGPVTAVQQLPTTSQWSNVSLKNTTRAILNELGGNTITGGTLPNSYSYEGYAARLLAVQEVNAACNITTGNSTTGELDTCQYLMENTNFSSSSIETYGYWLETPRSSDSSTAWFVLSSSRRVRNYDTNNSNGSVRPAIDVSISDIEY